MTPSIRSDLDFYQSVGFIDPRAPVADIGDDFSGDWIATNPGNYFHLPPSTRATYLDWLENRESTEYSTMYVLMYFAGLEKRFFIDASPRSEKKLIVAEVERLLNIYSYDPYTERVLNYFLGTAKLVLGLDQDVMALTGRYHPNYTSVVAAVGMKADAEEPLNGKWLLNWYLVNTKIRTSALRVFPEFKALFISLFEKKHPQGMTLTVPYRSVGVSYHAYSINDYLSLAPEIGLVGDVSEEIRPLSVADEIAEEAESALAKFGRYLGKIPERRESLAAHILLPHRIRNQFPCQQAEEIVSWTTNRYESKPIARFEEVVEKFQGTATVERITKTQAIKIIDTLSELRIGLAPDPRITDHSLKLEDSVFLYPLFDRLYIAFDEISENFQNIFRQLAIACFVVQPWRMESGKELHALNRLILGQDLTPNEQIRLAGHLRWMLQVPPTLPMLRKNLKSLTQSTKQELAQIALKMATFNGIAPPERVTAVEKVYKLLELDVSNVYSDLHSCSIGDAPVLVKLEREPQETFDIPLLAETHHGLLLDSKRIDSVIDDTARVSAVLGEIFEDNSQSRQHSQSDGPDGLLPGLDHQHGLLALELVQRDHWEEDELEQLAGQFNLMTGGALETLNEWSFETFDEPLVEEYDGYNLNPDVVEKIETL